MNNTIHGSIGAGYNIAKGWDRARCAQVYRACFAELAALGYSAEDKAWFLERCGAPRSWVAGNLDGARGLARAGPAIAFPPSAPFEAAFGRAWLVECHWALFASGPELARRAVSEMGRSTWHTADANLFILGAIDAGLVVRTAAEDRGHAWLFQLKAGDLGSGSGASRTKNPDEGYVLGGYAPGPALASYVKVLKADRPAPAPLDSGTE